MKSEEYNKLRDYALKLLVFRPRSQKEMIRKLSDYCRKKCYSTLLRDQLIKDLQSQNLVNDEEFAKWWIEQRRDFRPKGIIVLRQELLQKGISKEILDEVLLKESAEKEFEVVFSIVNKKIDSYKNLPKQKFYRKISGLLLRRGFAWDTINKVIDSFEKKS
ncbi:hypothetical protein A2Y99_02910 [Candidatus Gottesmanbacteria bacterium RBG_13_37_7]|uniref:Regulatory protein RecX n=1 Tax=Candidatus Gottesmanbacteria bacterium RBG_13_37_7 TaxID=1798369 RepID=A0A1F5YJ19_9BACT|nr:MAG: hypothetical protein A2Y99_02910 [Candidatus Gottesmanbacteria bacterium RBG_13_37_7]